MYVIHIKKPDGERLLEYANDMQEAAAKADQYCTQFAEIKIMPIKLKDMRQGKERSQT